MYSDLTISNQFYSDYVKAPKPVQIKVDRIIKMFSSSGKFPPSFNAHKALTTGTETWIGYVNRSREHWRILFYVLENSMVEFDRLLDHDHMDHELRTY